MDGNPDRWPRLNGLRTARVSGHIRVPARKRSSGHLRRGSTPLFGTLVLAAALALPAHALAGTYRVELCSPTANDEAFTETASPNETQGLQFFRECGQAFGGVRMVGKAATIAGALKWRVRAAPNTEIEDLEADRTFLPNPWDPLFHWFVISPGQKLEEAQGAAPAGGVHDYAVGGRDEVLGELVCIRPVSSNVPNGCGVSDSFLSSEVDMRNVVATMGDSSDPTISITPPVATIPLRGAVQIPYKAADFGSGVAVVQLLRDFERGVSAIHVTNEDRDSNGGECAKPVFTSMAPCDLNLSSSFSLDTTKIPDGTHTITAVAADASGNETETAAFTIRVHNAPTASQRPALSGGVEVGQTLSSSKGEWEGAPTAFAYQWLRCSPNVADKSEAGCAPIAGATQPQYASTDADAGKRLVARVTATNAFGPETALSAPSAPVEGVKSGGNEGGRGDGKGNPPQTRIAKHPRRRTSLRGVRFTFGSDQAGSSFQCKLDRAPFRPCGSPFRRRVRPGRHSFQVRALSSAGVADPTPALFRWKVS